LRINGFQDRRLKPLSHPSLKMVWNQSILIHRAGTMKSIFLLDFSRLLARLPVHFISSQRSNPFIMVVIRLRREGTKNRPFYRVVAADQRFKRDGRFIESLGTYDPGAEKGGVTLDVEKVQSWITKGAQPTDTVRALFKKAKAAANA
jgi:small subunit ribosomal protein S16